MSTCWRADSSPDAKAFSAGSSIPCSTPFIATQITSASQIQVWLNSQTLSLIPWRPNPNRPVRISAGATRAGCSGRGTRAPPATGPSSERVGARSAGGRRLGERHDGTRDVQEEHDVVAGGTDLSKHAPKVRRDRDTGWYPRTRPSPRPTPETLGARHRAFQVSDPFEGVVVEERGDAVVDDVGA